MPTNSGYSVHSAANASTLLQPAIERVFPMPSVSVRLTRAQIDDLIAMCQLGHARLNQVAAVLARNKPTIKRATLKQMISESAQDPGAAEAIARVLPGLAMAVRKFNIPVPELLQSVQSGLEAQKADDKTLQLWHECHPIISQMLSSSSVILYAKARDLSFDFERLYARSRILTDIRPVYDDERNEIIGANITQTLRIDYFSPDDGTKTLTIALDIPDIEQLKKCCEDAIQKADAARSLIEGTGREVVLPGERLQ